MDNQQKQSILDLPKVIAGGIASPVAALLTSRFGVAGTMVGLALSAVVVTVISDFLKVYLARIPGSVTSIPGGFQKKSPWQRFFYRLSHPFSKFSSLGPARRRSILVRSVIAGGIMFLVGLVVVTGLELSVGKDLSCWVWNDCPTETSASESSASSITTLPSILGGGRSTGRNPLQVVAPVPVQQQPTPPGSQGTLKQPSSPVPEQPSSSSSSQKQNSPSAGNQQQQSGYEQITESQQQSTYQQQTESEQPTEYPQQRGENQQQNLPSNPESQQQNLPSNPKNQQQNPSNSSNSDQQKGLQQALTPSPSAM